MQRIEGRVAQRGLNRDAAGPDAFGQERRRDVGALPGALPPIQRRHDRGVDADGRGVIAAACDRQGRRSAGIARQRQQAAAGPVGRDVESRQVGVRSLFAVAGEVGVDQPGIPRRDVLVFELEALARGMRRVDDHDVGPFDQPLENLHRVGRFQVDRHSALVAIVQMPEIVVPRVRLRRDLVHHSPQVAGGWLDLDDLGAEVGQDDRGARTRDETGEVHDLQAREDIVGCVLVSCHGRLLIAPGTVAGVSAGRPACLPACLRCRRTTRRGKLRGPCLRPGSSPCPCSPPRART